MSRYPVSPIDDDASKAHEATSKRGQDSTFIRGGSGSVDLDRIFDILGHQRRRIVLRYFYRGDDSEADISDIIGYILEWETELGLSSEPPARSAIELTLSHTHLPKLENLEVIEFDRDRGVVRYERHDALERFLEVSLEVSPIP